VHLINNPIAAPQPPTSYAARYNAKRMEREELAPAFGFVFGKPILISRAYLSDPIFLTPALYLSQSTNPRH
jgi:hypothetical protein